MLLLGRRVFQINCHLECIEKAFKLFWHGSFFTRTWRLVLERLYQKGLISPSVQPALTNSSSIVILLIVSKAALMSNVYSHFSKLPSIVNVLAVVASKVHSSIDDVFFMHTECRVCIIEATKLKLSQFHLTCNIYALNSVTITFHQGVHCPGKLQNRSNFCVVLPIPFHHLDIFSIILRNHEMFKNL